MLGEQKLTLEILLQKGMAHDSVEKDAATVDEVFGSIV